MNPTMNAIESSPSFFQRVQRAVAQLRFISFSLLLHVVIIVVGGSAVLFRQYVEPPDFVAEAGSFLDQGAAERTPPVELPKLDKMPPAPPTPEALSAPPISALTSVNPTNSFAMNAASAPNLSGKTIADLARKADALGSGIASGASMAKGGTAMRLFGMETKANTVVVVVDVSGSMVGGTKSVKTYEVLEREIGKLIKDLSEKNSFGIVAFSRDAEAYKPALARATREEKERGYNWLKRMSPEIFKDARASEEAKGAHHGTRADLGLKRAFEMQPDVIFFVSDGEPTGANPTQILQQVEAAQANRPQRTAIHTIAYVADSGQAFMRDLAQNNGGNFREVNPKDAR